MDKITEDKLDKIIKLLEDIKVNQPIPLPFYPPIQVYPVWPDPRPYVPQPYMPHYPDPYRYEPTWTCDTITSDGSTELIYQC